MQTRIRRWVIVVSLVCSFCGPVTVESAPSKPKPPPAELTPAQEFLTVIRKYDPRKQLVVDATPGKLQDQIVITVPNAFHRLHYQERLQAAQLLWQVWVSVRRPKDPDHARIKLVDLLGNEVGGSRALGGSLVWVQER
jgi:hypothetical protein